MAGRGPIRAKLKPLRMGLKGFFIGVVAIHASNDTHVSLTPGCQHLAEEIPGAQKLAMVLIGNLCGIEGHDSASIEQHSIHLQGGEVVHPLISVHGDGILLIEVDLAAALHRLIPGLVGIRSQGSESSSGSDDQ